MCVVGNDLGMALDNFHCILDGKIVVFLFLVFVFIYLFSLALQAFPFLLR